MLARKAIPMSSRNVELATLSAAGLIQFEALHAEAANAVAERLVTEGGPVYRAFGQRGREACRQDLSFHLEFLRPLLEFGQLQPMVDYLRWLGKVMAARNIPGEHVGSPLRRLGEYFAARMAPADGAAVAAAIKAACLAYEGQEPVPASAPAPNNNCMQTAAFESAVLNGRHHDAVKILHSFMDNGRSLVDCERHLIQPSLYSIGEKWERGEVSVAEEHMASAIIQSVMTIGLLRSPPPRANAGKAMFACVEGNQHAIGLRMICDAFQLAGWNVQFLGADVPTAALVRQVEMARPSLLGLSLAFPQHIGAVKETIAQLKERMAGSRPAVIIGGIAINRHTELAQIAGADALAVEAKAALIYGNHVLAGTDTGAVAYS